MEGMRFVPHRPHRQIAYAAGCLAVAAVSITVALLVTPMQPVSLAGQNLRVGAAAPSFSLSGPGELDLFGQRLPTKIAFAGPVRPRLELTQLTLGAQLAGGAVAVAGIAALSRSSVAAAEVRQPAAADQGTQPQTGRPATR